MTARWQLCEEGMCARCGGVGFRKVVASSVWLINLEASGRVTFGEVIRKDKGDRLVGRCYFRVVGEEKSGYGPEGQSAIAPIEIVPGLEGW